MTRAPARWLRNELNDKWIRISNLLCSRQKGSKECNHTRLAQVRSNISLCKMAAWPMRGDLHHQLLFPRPQWRGVEWWHNSIKPSRFLLVDQKNFKPTIMSFTRDELIRKQRWREAVTAFRKMSVLAGTFNANGKNQSVCLMGWSTGCGRWL